MTPDPGRSRAGLTYDRLKEIEDEANRALAIAAKDLAVLYANADAASDIDFVASLLTGANPEAYPNLELNGARVAGLLRPGSTGVEILYEAYHPFYRQRFSVAHELGHFYLHAKEGMRTYHRCSVRTIDLNEIDEVEGEEEVVASPIEAEADAFAGAFLLPAAAFMEAVNKYGFGSRFLAQLFRVSKGTVRNRLVTLKLIGIAPEKG
jgi:hypothetical protein